MSHKPSAAISRRGFTLGVLAASAVVLAACTSDPLAESADSGDASKGYISGSGAVTEFSGNQRPEPVKFSGVTDHDTTVTDADFLGAVTVVNFWYAACPPCRAEAADLTALYDEFAPQGVKFLGVNVRDGRETALAFARSYSVEYPSVLDANTTGGTVQAAFAAARVPPKAVPTTIVIGRDGRVTATILGQLDRGTVRALIKTAVDE